MLHSGGTETSTRANASGRLRTDSRSSRSSSSSSRSRSRSALLLTPPLNLTLYGAPAPRTTQRPSHHKHPRARRQRSDSEDLGRRLDSPAPLPTPTPTPTPTPPPGRSRSSATGTPTPSTSDALHYAYSSSQRFSVLDHKEDKFKSHVDYERHRYTPSRSPDYVRYSPLRDLVSPAVDRYVPELDENDGKDEVGIATKRETFYCDITDKKDLDVPTTCASRSERNNDFVPYVSKQNKDFCHYIRGHSAVPSFRPTSECSYDSYLSRAKSLPSVNNFSSEVLFKSARYDVLDSKDYRSDFHCKEYTTPSNDSSKTISNTTDIPVKSYNHQHNKWSDDNDKRSSRPNSKLLYSFDAQTNYVNNSLVSESIERDMLCYTEIRENYTNHCTSPLSEINGDKSEKTSIYTDKISDDSMGKSYNPIECNENCNDKSSRNPIKVLQNKQNSSHHVRFDVDSCKGINSNDSVDLLDKADKSKAAEGKILGKLNIFPDQEHLLKPGNIKSWESKLSPSKESTTDNASCSSIDNTCNSGFCLINECLENDKLVYSSTLVLAAGQDILFKEKTGRNLQDKETFGYVEPFKEKTEKIYSETNGVSEHMLYSPKKKDHTSIQDNDNCSLPLSNTKYSYNKERNILDSDLNQSSNCRELDISVETAPKKDYQNSSNGTYFEISKSHYQNEPQDCSNKSNFETNNSSFETLKKSTNEKYSFPKENLYALHRYKTSTPTFKGGSEDESQMTKYELSNKENASEILSVEELKYNENKISFSESERKSCNTHDKDELRSPLYSSKLTKFENSHSISPSPDFKFSLRELKDAAVYARQLATVLENIVQKHSHTKCSSRECTSQQFEASYLSDITWEEYSDEEWVSQDKHLSAPNASRNIPKTFDNSAPTNSNEENKASKVFVRKSQSPMDQFCEKNETHLENNQLLKLKPPSDCFCIENNGTTQFSSSETNSSTIQSANRKKDDEISKAQKSPSKYILNSCSSPNSDRCHCCGPSVFHLSPDELRQRRANLKTVKKENVIKRPSVNTSLTHEVADAIRNAIQTRREAFLPSDDTTCATSRSLSEWSV